ncbi:hypothetical protein B0H66DRAFT_528665 [Apodospora peruviana]|uniref:Uncharacterized protein n=1 Tax=Apodospora peruviana TaxID=516989 RepID=A0AAE0MG61_9PEZI|nr:hypothetical protein B0H66DRAFT_528665 [Apodospora peruviana]
MTGCHPMSKSLCGHAGPWWLRHSLAHPVADQSPSRAQRSSERESTRWTATGYSQPVAGLSLCVRELFSSRKFSVVMTRREAWLTSSFDDGPVGNMGASTFWPESGEIKKFTFKFVITRQTKHLPVGPVASLQPTNQDRGSCAVVAARGHSCAMDVAVLTDGEVWLHDETIEFVAASRQVSQGRIRLFAIGIGNAVCQEFVKGMAKAGGGYAEINPATHQGSWESRMVAILSAALTRHCGPIQFELDSGASTEVGEDGQAIVQRSPFDMSTLSPFSHHRSFTSLRAASKTGKESEHPQVCRKIFIRGPGEEAKLDSARINPRFWLGLRRSIVSQWTSFLAIKEDNPGIEQVAKQKQAQVEMVDGKAVDDDLGLLRPRGRPVYDGTSQLLPFLGPGTSNDTKDHGRDTVSKAVTIPVHHFSTNPILTATSRPPPAPPPPATPLIQTDKLAQGGTKQLTYALEDSETSSEESDGDWSSVGESGNSPLEPSFDMSNPSFRRLTPITGCVSNAKKGVSVHICDICNPIFTGLSIYAVISLARRLQDNSQIYATSLKPMLMATKPRWIFNMLYKSKAWLTGRILTSSAHDIFPRLAVPGGKLLRLKKRIYVDIPSITARLTLLMLLLFMIPPLVFGLLSWLIPN